VEEPQPAAEAAAAAAPAAGQSSGAAVVLVMCYKCKMPQPPTAFGAKLQLGQKLCLACNRKASRGSRDRKAAALAAGLPWEPYSGGRGQGRGRGGGRGGAGGRGRGAVRAH
jgi:hypothetical protein